MGDGNAWRALVQQSFQAFEADPLFRAHADYAFERLEEVGAGGMARVFRVYDHRARRDCALKVLTDASKPKRLDRFVREARVTALLDHPAIPPVYEYGRSGQGEIYMLMKLIRGETLKQALDSFHRKGRPKRGLSSLLRTLIRVCEALDYAHACGVIHRDLKPANIMIGAHGEVYLMDWGIARFHKESESEDERFRQAHTTIAESVFAGTLSAAGGVVGTYGYMPPEQAMGRAVSARSDLYALGAILYELLTGATIIGETGMAGVVKAMEGAITFPGNFGKGLPPKLAQLCRQCLQHDPEQRPASARAALLSLRSALDPSRSHRWLWLSAALIPIAGAAGWLGHATLAEPIIVTTPAPPPIGQGQIDDLNNRLDRALGKAQEALSELRQSRSEAEALREAAEEARLASAGAKPRSPEAQALYTEAAARARVGDWARAIAGYDAVLAIAPRDFMALFGRATSRFQSGAVEAALTDFNAALEVQPGRVEVIYNRGLALAKLDRYDAALLDLDRTVALSPKYSVAYRQRGQLLRDMKRDDDALISYNRCLAIDDKDWVCLYQRGKLYSDRKDYENALADYDRAIKIRPDCLIALIGRGYVYYLQEDYPKAIADFSAHIALAKDDPRGYDYRSRTYIKMAAWDEAIADLDVLLEKNPRNRDSRLQRATALVNSKRYKRGLEDVDALLASEPGRPDLQRIRGLALENLGRLSEAEAAYGSLLEAEPDDAGSLLARARVRKELGRKAEALADARKALSLTAEDSPARARIAALLAELEQGS